MIEVGICSRRDALVEPRRVRNAERGFSLIELLITVAVLGIVAAISVISLMTALDKSRQRATMADMRSIGRAIEAYHVDNGTLPDPSGGFLSLEPVLTPYQINVLPTRDHWGNVYTYDSDGIDYTLQSLGKDGIDGGDVTVASRNDYNLDIVLVNGQFDAAPE